MEEKFYRSNFYKYSLSVAIFVLIIVIILNYFNSNPFNWIIFALLILGIWIQVESWNSPIVLITDSKLIYQTTSLFRRKINLSNIKSVGITSGNYYLNKKIIIIYDDGGHDKKLIVFPSMIVNYERMLEILESKTPRPQTFFAS